MIPIGDRNPTRNFVFVNLLLLLANIAVFVYELSLGGQRLEAFINVWGVRSIDVLGLLRGDLDLLAPVLIKSTVSMFLHGGWSHIIFNMLFLWIFGDNVEDAFGHALYLVFYLVCGIVASLAQVLVNASSNVPGVGASGAIAGVLAAYIILFGARPVRVLMQGFLTSVPSYVMIGLWFVTQLLSGFGSLGQDGGGVAYWAHIGGFVCGLVLTFLLRGIARPRAAGSGAARRSLSR